MSRAVVPYSGKMADRALVLTGVAGLGEVRMSSFIFFSFSWRKGKKDKKG